MNDEQRRKLLQAAREGDQEAFAELFESLRSKIYGVAYEVVGYNHADDVVMETYLKAWQALPKFRGDSGLMTWLYRITRNCAIDFTRKHKRRRESAMPENDEGKPTIEDLPDAGQPQPGQELAFNEEQERILKAIEQLGEPHSITLKLYFIHEMSYKEIAVATDVSIGTVMSRLFHARRKLKRNLRSMDD